MLCYWRNEIREKISGLLFSGLHIGCTSKQECKKIAECRLYGFDSFAWFWRFIEDFCEYGFKFVSICLFLDFWISLVTFLYKLVHFFYAFWHFFGLVIGSVLDE